MKKITLFICLLIVTSTLLCAQSPEYKVIFDITSDDTLNHYSVIRQAGAIAKVNTDARLEVAVYGSALDLVLQKKSVVKEAVRDLATKKQVVFKVCAMTMARHHIDAGQLIAGVEIVPDAIFEIITKQKEGYGYIKVGR